MATILNGGLGCQDKILKGDHPSQFNLAQRFQQEDFNAIFYQNMLNLHNQKVSAERKISNKTPEYMLTYSLPPSCSKKIEVLMIYNEAAYDD